MHSVRVNLMMKCYYKGVGYLYITNEGIRFYTTVKPAQLISMAVLW